MKTKLLLAMMAMTALSPLTALALEEAPRNRILPFKEQYTCSGEWQKVTTRRNKDNVSTLYVGYRCVDKHSN